MQVKLDNDLFSPIDFTMVILQGEILSPLLFILHIADLVGFLKSKNLILNLGGTKAIIDLKYANDLALLACTAIHLRKLLEALEAYCDINVLTVNVSEIKILLVSCSGRADKRNETFTFKNKSIEMVSSFTYLGITFNSSLQGDAAILEAINKSKITIDSVLGILSKKKCID